MTTESGFTGFSGSLSSFRFDDETLLPYPDQFCSSTDGIRYTEPAVDASFTVQQPVLANSDNKEQPSNGDSPGDDNDISETVFKYISQMLMEEDMEEQQILPDPWALQAAEKSLYDVLDYQKHPSSETHYCPLFLDSPDNNSSGSSSDFDVKSSSSGSLTSGTNSVEPNWLVDFGQNGSVPPQNPLPQNFVFQSLVKPSRGFGIDGANEVIELLGGSRFSNLSTQSVLVSQFQKGVEEASKFLPKGNQWFTDLEMEKISPEIPPMPEVKAEKDEIDYRFPFGYREKKNHDREDVDFEQERSTKQLALSLEEADLSEMFDKILIFPDGGRKGGHCKGLQNEANEKPHYDDVPKPRPKKPVNVCSSDKKEVDLRMLLILCAQAVSANDRRTANEYLKQIRRHASPFGDGSQRIAHYFANGLEARLGGNGSRNYNSLDSRAKSAVDVLMIYQVYLSACPFRKLGNIFTNNKILIAAEKATTLHIIDFGILYGFQWPALIFRLSRRAGGPPKLRITGIELPERGFRPAARVQQTGRHLAKCCERFNVPFEYNAVAQKWETIRVDDLKLRNGEMVVVNCMFRFENLLDETVVLNNPRNSVLHLVKRIKPDLFTQCVVNGSYNAPFFVTRFREALFHYTALFDALDSNLGREDQMRLMFEKECYGREVMNIIACEGVERVERPETYKQWQIRNMRAGLKQVPLNQMIMKKLRFKLKMGYSEDFVIDEDGHWMLQGWKGRILYASSYWVPA